MGKIVFLATLGNSDLAQNGRTFDRNTFRSRCLEIEASYAQVKDSLSLPLLDPCLYKVEEISQRKPDLVFLFFTRQEPPREDDTDVAARLIRSLLKERWVGSREIKLIHLGGSPAHYGEVLQFFHEFFLKEDISMWERCFLSITGGTPAMSAGLLFVGVMRLREKAEVLYVPRGSNEAFRLDTPSKLLYLIGREEIISLCQRRDYAAALEVLRHTPSLPYAKEAELLLSVAHYRCLRDFEHALSKLNEAEPLIIRRWPVPQVYSSWRESLRRLVQTPPLVDSFLVEIFYCSQVMLKQEAFVPFLSELFSLMEGILGWQLERASKGAIPLDKGDRERRQALKNWLEEHPEVKGWLQENAPDIDPQLGPNQKVVTALLKALSQLHHDPKERVLCQKIAELAEELEPLRELRNRITHRFEGASSEKIERYYPAGPAAALEKVKGVLGELGVSVEVDPYDEWNRWLEEWL